MPEDQSSSLISRGSPAFAISFSSAGGTRSVLYRPGMNLARTLCVWDQTTTIRHSVILATTVAIAAPTTPRAGAPSFPKMRI